MLSSGQVDNPHFTIENPSRRAEMMRFIDDIKRNAQMIKSKKVELDNELTHSNHFYQQQEQLIEDYYSPLMIALEEHKRKTLDALNFSKASNEHPIIQQSQLFDQSINDCE
jgi:hypothetical protein